MPHSTVVSDWASELVARAGSGELSKTIDSVFGAVTTSEQLSLAKLAFARLADGDLSVLPGVQVLSADTMAGKLGAYSADTDTIYINEAVLEQPSIAFEVLTHELGHAVASRYFAQNNAPDAAYGFTHALLGQDHALMLSSGASHDGHDGHDGHDDQASAACSGSMV